VCVCGCRSVEADNRTVSLYEQDSFEDEFIDLGTCVALYSFEGSYVFVFVCVCVSVCFLTLTTVTVIVTLQR